ncbi:MAG: glycosyltransferase family 4 protein [Candidatus Bathyarchaeota archaeon]|nr:glycosyltransferase family 4 protein [Candidatus Bathyarchaeota archaeon]
MSVKLDNPLCRSIYLEGRLSGWDFHSLYNEIVSYPPEGYTFLVPKGSSINQSRFYPIDRKIISYSATKYLYDCIRPLIYYSALSKFSPTKINADLIYVSQHVVNYNQPWVVDLEHAGALAAYGRTDLVRKTVEKAFRSPYCKKILPWTNMAKKSLEACFDCGELDNKIEVVSLAVHPKNFKKEPSGGPAKILFVGTANPSNIIDFYIKGGREMIEAFSKLKKIYPNLELVMRCYVPPFEKTLCSNLKGLRIIDNLITYEELSNEFKTADIFVFPGHSTPGMVILDAMSYELPVVTTDVWANNELVDNGRTGFLVNCSKNVKYSDKNFLPLWRSPSFIRKIREPHDVVVQGIVERISILIEDEAIRRKMGLAGRYEIENGKFSITLRNKKLARIFDDAVA